MTEGRRYLVTIGVGTYRDGSIGDLPGATEDARRVRARLEPMGYETVLPGLGADPTARDLAEGAEEWAHAADLGPHDVVVVCFAGHGVRAPDRHYLLCSTSRPGRYATALPSEDLCRPLMHSPFGHLLVLLDTCYAVRAPGTSPSWPPSSPTPGAGRRALASARGEERAYENAFVDALAAHGSDIVVGMRNDIVVLGRVATPPPPPRSPAPPPPARTAPATPPAARAWPS
ncbi:caspase domain-containing protein [Streptomyces sp. NPDC013953]|uniref:caspase family protein n=1 Tax=Streptomyces sp. NPDC013953 TaxID=3364868 RepID=UPI0036F91CC8